MDGDFENENSGSDLEKHFSYSLENAIESFEDDEILEEIRKKYPKFVSSAQEKDLRQIFVTILDDRKFIKEIGDPSCDQKEYRHADR